MDQNTTHPPLTKKNIGLSLKKFLTDIETEEGLDRKTHSHQDFHGWSFLQNRDHETNRGDQHAHRHNKEDTNPIADHEQNAILQNQSCLFSPQKNKRARRRRTTTTKRNTRTSTKQSNRKKKNRHNKRVWKKHIHLYPEPIPTIYRKLDSIARELRSILRKIDIISPRPLDDDN